MTHRKLLVLIHHRLSEIVRKGEIVEDYYNPGGFFDEILILSMANDSLTESDRKAVQKLGGRAKVGVRNISWIRSFFCFLTIPILTRLATRPLQKIATDFKPHLMRAYGNQSQAYLGLILKKRLKVPFIVSVHDCYDLYRKQVIKGYGFWHWRGWLERVLGLFQDHVARLVARGADLHLAVYESVADYLRRLGADKIEVVYNSVAADIPVKKNYSLDKPPVLLNVGRQTPDIKEPSTIIRAMPHIDAKLVIIGEGPMRPKLEALAKDLGVENKVEFRDFIPNDKLVESLPNYDFFVYRYLNWEISKSVIEALLAGLPVVLNENKARPVAEFKNKDYVCLVQDTPENYAEAINALLQSETKRRALGEKAHRYAKNNFDPKTIDQQIVTIYKRFV